MVQRYGWAVPFALASMALILAPPQSRAQDGIRAYQEELRVQLDQQNLAARDTGVDAGGWLNFAYFNFDDAAAQRNRTLRQYEIRGWAAASLQGVHKAYIRGLAGWDDWNHGDNLGTGRGDDQDDQRLERAWYQFDLGQMVKNESGQSPPFRLRAKVGREYETIGTGLVLAMPMDVVEVQGAIGNLEAKGILGKSIWHTNNIDRSAAVADHQKRCFWGGELAYLLDHHRPFVYFLNNDDRTDPSPDDEVQSYEYTSRYVGMGSTGNLILPDLRYQTELAGEWGRTYSSGVKDGSQDHICAWAYDALLEYLFQVRTHPKVNVEYLYGSGDADRGNATATVGGNATGTPDNAFNAFGYRDTGLAFAPEISNIHIYSLGSGFYPLESVTLFRKLEMGTKVFFFQKATGSGGISDSTATRNNQWLGWEWDAYCDWRITSDVTWTVRYGAFQPSEAFGDDRTCRQFVYTGMTFSF